MIGKWIAYLEKGRLPFYWDKKCNLLEGLNFSSVCNHLKKILKKLEKFESAEKFLEIFLTPDEISELNMENSITQTDIRKTDKNLTETETDKDSDLADATEKLSNLNLKGNSLPAIETGPVLRTVSHMLSCITQNKAASKKLAKQLVEEVIRRMKDADNRFNESFNKVVPCGISHDDLHAGEFNEFEYNILIKLPKKVTVRNKAGLIQINVSECKDETVFGSLLQKHLDKKGFLQVTFLQTWFQSLFSKISKKDEPIIINGFTSSFTIRKTESGHILDTKCEDDAEMFNLSIKLIPGFQFGSEICISKKASRHTNFEWSAIEERIYCSEAIDNTLFMPFYPQQESKIIKENNQLKSIFCFINKMCSRKKIGNLNSYHTTTVLLWVNEREKPLFWRQSQEEILSKILSTLGKCFEQRKLQNYWHPEVNMLKKFSVNQIDTMRSQLQSIIDQFEKVRDSTDLYNLFLTETEKEQWITEGLNNIERNVSSP